MAPAKFRGPALVKTVSSKTEKFHFPLTLTFDLDATGEVPAKAWVTQMLFVRHEKVNLGQTIPASMKAQCTMTCTVTDLLKAVQLGVNRGPLGTHTTKEWDDTLALLLTSNPLIEALVDTTRNRLDNEEPGSCEVTVERDCDEKGRNKTLKVTAKQWSNSGKTCRTSTESCEWTDPPELDILGAEVEGKELDKQQGKQLYKQLTQTSGGVIQINGETKPAYRVSGCLLCTVM